MANGSTIFQGGILTLLTIIIGTTMNRVFAFRKEARGEIKEMKDQVVEKAEYEGHKKLCGSEFEHIKEDLSEVKNDTKNMSNTMTEVRDIVLELKTRADERRRGDLSA